MLQLTKISSDKFLISSHEGPQIMLTMEKMIKRLMSLHIELKEIEVGLAELIKQDHDVAHYGINGMFLFTNKEF